MSIIVNPSTGKNIINISDSINNQINIIAQNENNINVLSNNLTDTNHNSLTNIQGGRGDEYYHLNSLQYNNTVYTTGDQSLNGPKTFQANILFEKDISVYQNLRVSGSSFFSNNLSVTGNLNVSGNINNPNLVLTKTNQTISGDKTFADKININSNIENEYDNTNNQFALNIRGNENAGILIDAYGIDPPQIVTRRSRGTPTNLSGILENDVLFNLQTRGYVSGLNAYSSNSKAAIRLIAAENWIQTANYTGQGVNILFKTTNIGSDTSIDKAIIGTSGINILDGNIYVDDTPVLLSGSTPFVINYGHIRNNTSAGPQHYYFGTQMDIDPVSLPNNDKRRVQILQNCFLRKVAWTSIAKTKTPTPSDAITGYFKNFGNNPSTDNQSAGIQVTSAINIPSVNTMYTNSTQDLNIPITSGDYVSFYYQTNFTAGSNNLASGLAINVNAYFYV